MNNNVKLREEIIAELIKFKVSHLDADTRLLLINNNWGLTQEQYDKCDYPFELKNELLKEYSPKHAIMSAFYNPLIEDIFIEEFSEYTNSELEHVFYELTGEKIVVNGIENKSTLLFDCPCCQNKTLAERGQYFICSVCDWEDDGLDYDHISHCNGMKLSEAQKNFKKCGKIYQNY